MPIITESLVVTVAVLELIEGEGTLSLFSLFLMQSRFRNQNRMPQGSFVGEAFGADCGRGVP